MAEISQSSTINAATITTIYTSSGGSSVDVIVNNTSANNVYIDVLKGDVAITSGFLLSPAGDGSNSNFYQNAGLVLSDTETLKVVTTTTDEITCHVMGFSND